MPSSVKRLFTALFLGLLSLSAHADWELNNAYSNFYYVTSKASAVSEVNSFSELTGTITSAGLATLEIDLSSVDTAIEIRDQRVRDILFETQTYPTASISINVNSEALSNLAVGSSEIANYNYSLNLHGVSRDLNADLLITKTSANRLEIQPARPIILGAGLFNLAEGVEALREVAGLPSINPNVVIDFSLVYDDIM
jgi:polyisoprenoid-binding protein YceI